jgi:hypothetical protein
VNVFGGGLALFTTGGKKVGGIGVSGDTSCTDHFAAWRVRNTFGLDHLGAPRARRSSAGYRVIPVTPTTSSSISRRPQTAGS